MSDDISPTEFLALQRATVIDVREPDEFAAGHLAGAIDIPLGQLRSRSGEIPDHRPLVLVCASGRRSAEGAAYLRSTGVPAVSIEGGMHALEAQGVPTVAGA